MLIRQILKSREYSDLLAAVSRLVTSQTGVSVTAAHLAVVHPDAPDVRLRALFRRGMTFDQPPGPIRRDLAEHGLELHRPKYLDSKLPEYAQQHRILLEEPPPSRVLILPLTKNGEAAIVCELGPGEEMPPAIEDRLDEVLEAASSVLPACTEFEQLRRERNEMQEIFEAATSLQGADSPAALALTACELMVERLHFDRALLAVFEQRSGELAGIGSAGFNEAHTSIRLPVPDHPSVLCRAFKGTSAEWHPVLQPDSPLCDGVGDRRRLFHVLCLPLIVAGRCRGVLYADHRLNRAQITPNRLVSLQLFANSVASALEALELLAQVGRLADQDGLTGLSNRRAFDSALRREVLRATRYSLPLSVLMIDVDKFKEANDQHGHKFGDDVLVATAAVLSDSVRETDFVARYGGDEFVVLMANTDARQAGLVRERIVEAVARKAPDLNRGEWTYSLSLGLRSAEAAEAEKLLESADKALYAHKEAQVRRGLLEKLVRTPVEELANWNHYLGKILRVLHEKEAGFHEHSLRVMNLSVGFAKRMSMTRDEIEAIALASLLHDVGKISVPTGILTRPGPLSPKEYRMVMAHPKVGVDLLSEVNYMGDVCDIIASHHERWDGQTGCEFPAYPAERKGRDIPLGARILKLADSYDAMTSLRPYSTPLLPGTAQRVLREQSGRSFDPDLVGRFISMLEETVSRSIQVLASR